MIIYPQGIELTIIFKMNGISSNTLPVILVSAQDLNTAETFISRKSANIILSFLFFNILL